MKGIFYSCIVPICNMWYIIYDMQICTYVFVLHEKGGNYKNEVLRLYVFTFIEVTSWKSSYEWLGK